MTSRQIKCFLHLSENLSFARTAEELFTSQPAITRDIQALESELGVTLFNRTRRSVSLTPAGISFREDMIPLYARFNTAVAKARNCQKNFYQQLNIGYCHAASLQLLPEGLRRFHELHPAVYLRPVSGELRKLNADFLAGSLDILFGMKSALTPTRKDGFELLYKGYLCVNVPVGHPLYQARRLTVADLDGHTIITSDSTNNPAIIETTVQKILQQCPNSIITPTPNVDETTMLLHAGLGVSIAPQYSMASSPAFRMIPLDYPELQEEDILDYYICYHRDGQKKHIKRFVSVMQELYQNNTPG